MVKTWKRDKEGEDETYQIMLDSAINTIQEGNISPAIQLLKDIVKIYPDDALPYLYLANLYSIQDEKEAALGKYEKAWEMKDNLQNRTHLIPYQTIFLLLTFEPIPIDRLKFWLNRASNYHELYDFDSRLIINLARNIVEGEKYQRRNIPKHQ